MDEALADDIRRFWSHCLPSPEPIADSPHALSFEECKAVWQRLGMSRIHACAQIPELGQLAFDRLTELPAPSLPHHPHLLLYTLYLIFYTRTSGESFRCTLEQVEFLRTLREEGPLEARLFDRLWRDGALSYIHEAPLQLTPKTAPSPTTPLTLHQLKDRLLYIKRVLEEQPVRANAAGSPASRQALQKLRVLLDTSYRGDARMNGLLTLLGQIESAMACINRTDTPQPAPKRGLARPKGPASALMPRPDDVVLDWTTGDIVELRQRASSVPARLKQQRRLYSQELESMSISSGFPFADMPKLDL